MTGCDCAVEATPRGPALLADHQPEANSQAFYGPLVASLTVVVVVVVVVVMKGMMTMMMMAVVLESLGAQAVVAHVCGANSPLSLPLAAQLQDAG